MEMNATLELFKTSENIPYKQFRQLMKKLYDETSRDISFDDFYYHKVVEVLTNYIFDPPTKIEQDEYEQIRMLEKVLVFLCQKLEPNDTLDPIKEEKQAVSNFDFYDQMMDIAEELFPWYDRPHFSEEEEEEEEEV
jgi:hypothetical protein